MNTMFTYIQKVTCLVLFYFIFSTLSFAQENWTWLNPKPMGSSIEACSYFPGTNIVAAVGKYGIIYRSSDHGTTWEHIQANITADLGSISLITSLIGYAAGANTTLLKTTDAGLTWSPLTISGVTGTIYQIHFVSESVGFLRQGVGVNKIYITTNGGLDWSDLGLDGSNGDLISMQAVSASEIILGTSTGLVIRSQSPGWSVPSTIHTFSGAPQVTALAVYGSKFVAVTGSGLIAYSHNAGSTWSAGTVSPSDLTFFGVAFLSDQNLVAFTQFEQLRTSTDAGASWSEAFPAATGQTLSATSNYTGNGIILGTDGTQYNTTNSGSSWAKSASSITSALLTTSDTFDGNPIWAAGSGGTLIVSTDGGTSWSAQNTGITDTIKSIKFVTDLTGFMVAKYKIYKSTDGGTSWSNVYSAPTNIYLNAITAFDADNIAVAGSSKNIYFTSDGGANWTNKTVGTGDNNAIFALPGTSIVFTGGGSNKIFKSVDKCSTWSAGSSAVLALYSIYFTSASNGWAVGNAGKIFKTTNGGDVWTQVFSGLTTNNLRSVKFSGTDHGIITGNFGTVLKTQNAGTDWTLASRITESQLASSTLIDNSTVLAFGAIGSIIKSYNAPLPVELVGFTASHKNGTVTLNWETKTEIDNYGFEIERRSAATHDWQRIGFVEGHFTTNSPKYYNFTDRPTGTGKIQYRLKQIDNDGSFEYSHIAEVLVGTLPDGYLLEQNYPNPFNPSTTIGFTAQTTGFVKLVVYNPLGETVKVLFSDIAEAGRYYKLEFDATGLTSGVYFYRLEAENFKTIKKLTLVK